MSGYQWDGATDEATRSLLGAGGNALGDAGSGAPAAPDAGAATQAVAAILQSLGGEAMALRDAVTDAGARLDATATSYSTTEQSASRSLNPDENGQS